MVYALVDVEFVLLPETVLCPGGIESGSLIGWGFSGKEFLGGVLSIGRHAWLTSVAVCAKIPEENNLDPELSTSFSAVEDTLHDCC